MSVREAEGRGEAGTPLDEVGETFAGGVTFWGGGTDFVLEVFLEGGGMDFVLRAFLEGEAAAFTGGAGFGGVRTTLADWDRTLAGAAADLGTVGATAGTEDSILAGTEGDFAGGRTGRIGGAADFFGLFFLTATGLGLDAAGLGLDAVCALAFLASDCTGLGFAATGLGSDSTDLGFDPTGLDIGDGGGFPLFW